MKTSFQRALSSSPSDFQWRPTDFDAMNGMSNVVVTAEITAS